MSIRLQRDYHSFQPPTDESSISKRHNVVEELASEPSSCIHYWLIERPLAETSHGVCKICGAARDFLNEPVRAFYVSRPKAPLPHTA